jgi:hypothetical protein
LAAACEDRCVPRLFAGSAAWVAEGTGVDQGVPTPFGIVNCTATVGGQEVVAVDRERWRVSDIAWLERWESSGMELERLTCKLQPALPEGMRVDGCWGVLWRFLAHQEIAHFGAAARLTAAVPKGSGHTGEHLVAVAFESDAGEMHIGTEDEDALAERAGDGTLPDRWWRNPPEDYDGPWFPTEEEAMAAAPPPDEWTDRWYESHGPVAWWREFRQILSDIKDVRPVIAAAAVALLAAGCGANKEKSATTSAPGAIEEQVLVKPTSTFPAELDHVWTRTFTTEELTRRAARGGREGPPPAGTWRLDFSSGRIELHAPDTGTGWAPVHSSGHTLVIGQQADRTGRALCTPPNDRNGELRWRITEDTLRLSGGGACTIARVLLVGSWKRFG